LGNGYNECARDTACSERLLQEKKVPNGVIRGNLEVDSIEKKPMDPVKEVQFCNNIKIEAILFLMCQAISKGTFGN
jgi:hypothetical protein